MSKLLLITFIFLVFVWRLTAVDFSSKTTSAKGYQSPFERLGKPKNIFARRIDRLLGEPQASLLNGMVWGIKANMPNDFYQALKRTGTLHIIVISGTNIVILINVAARWFYFLGRRWSVLLTMVFISLFICFVGLEPPVVRAGLMGAVGLSVIYFGKREYSLLTLLGVVLTMLFSDPNLMGDLSFQLSFSATLGLILFGLVLPVSQFPHNYGRVALKNENAENEVGRVAASGIRPLGEMAKVALITTLSAQLFTLPIILANFGSVSLIGPIANLAVGWLTPLLTISGLILSLISLLSMPMAKILTILLWPMLTYFVNVITLLSRVPMAAVYLGRIGLWIALVYYLGLLGGMFVVYKVRNKKC